MGSMDRAALDVRQARNTTPQAPDNGAAEKTRLLEMDLRERALALAIKATKQGLLQTQCYTNPEKKVLAVAGDFYKFLKDGTK